MTATDEPSSNQTVVLQVAFAFVLIVGLQIAVARFQISTESKRRWQHGATGHAFVVLSYVLPIGLSIGALLLGAAGMYYLRRYQTDSFLRLFGPLLRAEEKQGDRLPGAFYFLLGTALTALMYPIDTARYAVECLALADPVAAWVGRSVQSPSVNDTSSAAGCLACFATAWLVGAVYLQSVGQIAAGALVVTLVEAYPIISDNLMIPLAAATVVDLF